MVSTNVPVARKNITDYVVLALCLFGIFSLFEIKNFTYFRDYSITFEGAYRIFLGQIPYRDFGSPVGPGSFVIPALFFKLFGANWTVFLLSQQFQNTCLLFLIYALLKKINVSTYVKLLSLIIFSIFYLSLLSHPWYNSTGTLLMFGSVLCALASSRTSIIASGILAAFSLLTKQDFGLLAFLISTLFIALKSLGSDSNIILPKLMINQYRELGLILAKNMIVFASTFIAVIAIFIYSTDAEGFKYWFNYGQDPQNVRAISSRALLYGSLGAFMMFVALSCNNFRIFMASIFIIASSITSSTSGLGFTHYYFVAFMPIIIYETLKINIQLKNIVIFFTLFLSVVVMFKPTRDTYRMFESLILNKPEHFFFDYRRISGPLVSFPAGLLAFSPHTQAPQQTVASIKELKRIAEEKRINTPNKSLSLLNLSELTPIYPELNIEPPIGLPLWFHTKVSLFPQEIKKIDSILADNIFDIILIQGTHEGLTPTYQNFLSVINSNKSYELFRTIDDSPANATWPCAPNCQGQIFVYVKRLEQPSP